MTTLLLVHAAATLAMTGLIWFVQVVHYPLMARVGRDGFVAYERAHTRRTSFVVGPLMLVEAASAAALPLLLTAGPARRLALAGAALLAVVWASTAVLQVPRHRRLESGWDESAWRALTKSNWIRTAAWSLRALLALVLLAGATGGAATPG